MKVSHILNTLIALPTAFLMKLFPVFSYKGIINTQINIYNKIKKRYPDMPEDEVLNSVLISRIRAPLGPVSKEEEDAHYAPLLQHPNKTLRDVIWAIIEYECVLSREEHVFRRLSKMGLSPSGVFREILMFEKQVVRDIEESIAKKVRKGS